MKQTFFLLNTLLALSICGVADQYEYETDEYYDDSVIADQTEYETEIFYDDYVIADQSDSDMDSSSDQSAPQMSSSSNDARQMQGEPLNATGFTAGYNTPAVIDVSPKNMPIRPESTHVFIDGAFTYWYAGEDGLEIAENGVLNGSTLYFPKNGKTVAQSSEYKPGFKVALGVVGEHEWSAKAEYTWYRGTTHTTSSQSPTTVPTAGIATSTASTGTSVLVVDTWFQQGTSVGQALSGSKVSSSWHLAMDIVDVVFGRPFYTGRAFTVSPFGGLRTAWIRQTMKVNLTENPAIFSGSIPAQPIQSRNSSNSWSLGGIMGCQSEYLLPMGFRLEGDASASLLYTQYTSINHSEDAAATTFNAGPYTLSVSNYSAMRPMAELGLGFGWGRYLSNGDFHIDFSADYDFMMFWSQNMFRKLIDHNLTGTGSTPGDLYLHGLTFTARFDF